jgi:hypothetical protein
MMVREISATKVRLTASRANNAAGCVRRISVTSLLVAGLCAGLAARAQADDKNKDAWNIRILPATKLIAQVAPPKSAAAPAPQEPGGNTPARGYEPQTAGASGQPRIIPGPSRSMRAPGGRPSYADVYRSIPFSWSEYAANPSYRNQTALALMLNQMPYPSASASQVPQYGYVTPYLWDRTYGVPSFTGTYYWGGFGGGWGW